MTNNIKLIGLIFLCGVSVAMGQQLPNDVAIYDKSKHLIKKSSEIPIERMKQDCVFFPGDSLDGFDMDAAIHEGLLNYKIYRGLRVYLFRKEAEFVKSKFHILQQPAETFGNKKAGIPDPEIMVGCSNVDFESGSFAGWTGRVGYNALSTNPITVTSTGIVTTGVNASWKDCSYHTLTTAAGGNDY
ncbi:MAG TPA: hypothetical protein VNX68_14115, partial [Nitrosopumilaceae archaeon]|nr:hypothetical protein [Nitrosopumilaceae archaeon]